MMLEWPEWKKISKKWKQISILLFRLCTWLGRRQLKQAGYTMFHGTIDPLIPSVVMQSADVKPNDLPCTNICNPYEVVMSTFRGEKTSWVESECMLWNPLLNSAVENVNFCNNDNGKARYKSTEELLDNNFEVKDIVKFLKSLAVIDV